MCGEHKIYVLAISQLAIFDLKQWQWTLIELIKHPHMIQPTNLFVNTSGNLVTHFYKPNSKHRQQIYVFQL